MDIQYNLPYTKFASPYSSTDEIKFGEKMAITALSLIDDSIKINHVVDIACGMGSACISFYKKGFEVTGIDLSADMLNEAKRIADRLNYKINWLNQDMRSLSVPNKAELITCMYDSLNFMQTDEDLLSVFVKVFDSLNKDGIFVFDIYTVFGMSVCWENNKEEIHTNEKNHFITTKTTWDADTFIGTKTFYGFSKSEDSWHRWHEIHSMRAYPIEKILSLLKQCGFSPVSCYDIDDFKLTDLSNNTKRALITAQKQT